MTTGTEYQSEQDGDLSQTSDGAAHPPRRRDANAVVSTAVRLDIADVNLCVRADVARTRDCSP